MCLILSACGLSNLTKVYIHWYLLFTSNSASQHQERDKLLPSNEQHKSSKLSLKTKFKGRFDISHLKISNSDYYFFSSLCISLQLLFTHHSPDPRLEATTKAGSSGITDERR